MDLSEVSKLEQQQRITKLSEAIRIGARIRPQGMRMFSHDGRSCAIGAALEAYYGSMPQQGEFTEKVLHMTRLLTGGAHVLIDIYRWNDEDGMTREQIADKLQARGL